MTRAIFISILLLLISAQSARAAVSPLSDSEKTRLEAVADGSSTVDEAGLYALLENTTRWPGDETGSQMIVPNYQQLLDHPADYRGQLCLIEGTLYQVHTPQLSHTGWKAVRNITIDISRDPAKHQFIMLYLTAPPAFKWWKETEGLPIDHGSKVRILARFFKVVMDNTRGGEDKKSVAQSFPVFVGRSMVITSEAPAPEDSGGIGRLKGIGIAAAVVVAAGFLVFRIFARQAPVSQMDIYRQRKEERRQQREATGAEAEDDEPLDLTSGDPSEALDKLAQRHDDQPPQSA